MAKDSLERFGVSMGKNLLNDFDRFIKKQGYGNRSEAIRDMVREKLSEEGVEKAIAESGEMFAVLTMVYDHHKPALMEKITHIQHDFGGNIIATMHIHMDHDNCMEMIAFKGPGNEITDIANKLSSTKGVLLGKFIVLPNEIPR